MTAARGKTRHTIRAGPRDVGERLDRLLAEACADLSRTRVKALIKAGLVSADDGTTIVEPSYRVKLGQTFAIIVPEARPPIPEPQAIGLDVVYEDAHLIVIDKPAGMVVHPAPGNPDATLVNALIAHCGESLSGIGGVRRPGIVHRLDKDTSGLMVAAKTDAAHIGLARQFAAHRVARAYLAVVWGVPGPRAGEIEGNIGRNRRNRKKMAVVARGGKPALTRYRVLRVLAAGAASLVTCRPLTGRTHQIRVHMAARRHPLVGDRVYGRARSRRLKELPKAAQDALAGFKRHALHAYLIGFDHPITAKRITLKSNIPSDIKGLIETLE